MTPEDGTGKADADTYIDPAGAFAVDYFTNHLYASEWSAASDPQKQSACIMATRLIDAVFSFKGNRTKTTQALAWPRENLLYRGEYIASNLLPRELKQAVCEQALLLLRRDRTTDTGTSAPVKSLNLGKGALVIDLEAASDPAGAPVTMTSDYVATLLRELISARGDTGGVSKVVRS